MLTTLRLSAQQRRPKMVLLAAMSALTLASTLAATVGFVLAAALPLCFILPISATLFIIMGLNSFRGGDYDIVCATNTPRRFANMFSLVLFSEIGDKSQVVILSLDSTTFFPLFVIIGAIVGFLVVNSVGALICLQLAERLPIRTIREVTGIIFILFGILTLLGGLRP